MVWLFSLLLVAAVVWIVVASRRALKAGKLSSVLTGVLLVGNGVTAVVCWVVFRLADLDLEHDTGLLWGICAVLSLIVGALGAKISGKVPGGELLLATGATLVLLSLAVVPEASVAGFAAPAVRAALVSPAVLLLCSYFGGSVGFLFFTEGGKGLSYEGRIGRRFLLSKSSSVISTVTAISVLGVALGVALVIASLGILSGFENDLQDQLIGAYSHVVLQRVDRRPFEPNGRMRTLLDGEERVEAYAPVIEGEVAIASRSNYTGSVVFGIDPEQTRGVLDLIYTLAAGDWRALASELTPADRAKAKTDVFPAVEDEEYAEEFESEFEAPRALPGIVIGIEMARALSVEVGDTVRLLSPLLGTLTPVGLQPKSAGFRIVGIFRSDRYEYDAKFAFISLPGARTFFELKPKELTGMMMRVSDASRSDEVGADLRAALDDEAFEALDWKSRNQTLFAALKLERIVAFVVLTFIILVASFSIVNTLTMSVIEKRKEIAILKTMGAQDVSIMKVFLVQGLTVGGFGIAIGASLGVALLLLLEFVGFWIPDEVYYIDSLPVNLDAVDVVLVVVSAVLIVWNFAVFPALRGARLLPVDGLRDG